MLVVIVHVPVWRQAAAIHASQTHPAAPRPYFTGFTTPISGMLRTSTSMLAKSPGCQPDAATSTVRHLRR
jgi:hypothetical protein